MNATGLPSSGVPTADALISEMSRSLVMGVRMGAVDLGDERSISAALRGAGFSRADIHQLAERAIDRTRVALQTAGRRIARAAEPGALLLIIGVWLVAYVGLNPPAHAPHHHKVEVAHV